MPDRKYCFHNATVFTGFSVMEKCAVVIKKNKIVDIFNEGRFQKKKFKDDMEFINLNGCYIAPGFIDTHIHGIEGHASDDGTANSILEMSESLLKYGVTSFIPTLYSAKKNKLVKEMRTIIKAIGKEEGAHILGIHLEGPFISPERLGVQKKNTISPVNMDLVKELIREGKGHIVNMTVAPELKNMRELALYCISKGIILQAGHTDANYDQMMEGMQARILHTTHLFNAMSRIHHRDPGAVGAVLIQPDLSCELIADGIHIDHNLIKLLVQYKPIDKLVLVTDSLKPTKQKTPPLIANGEEVYLDGCFYRKKDNVMAGSALTMIEGVRNLVDWGLSIEQAVKMASTNPARIMRLEHKGMIAPGYDADLVVFNQDFDIKYTIVGGKICEF